MKLSLLFLIPVLVMTPSCAIENKKKVEIVYGAGEMYQKWQRAVEQQCEKETAVLVLTMFEAKPTMTENDVNRLKNMLMFSCSDYYGLAI